MMKRKEAKGATDWILPCRSKKELRGRLTPEPSGWISQADGFTVPFHKLHLGRKLNERARCGGAE